MKSQPLLRLDKTPATQRPPSADCVDLIFDAEAGVLKAIDAEGEVPFSGATGGGEVTPASLVTAAQAMTPTQEAGMRTNIGPFVDVTSAPYNAVGDAKFRHDAAISSGSSTLTSATAGFVADDVGKYIRIVGAGTTATATLAVSGGAITGGTVTNPGSVGAYPANTTFPLLITGPGLNAAVTATTNANGQVASIAVPAGGTGYTSAGCTFPPADLIATIATRVSDLKSRCPAPRPPRFRARMSIGGPTPPPQFKRPLRLRRSTRCEFTSLAGTTFATCSAIRTCRSRAIPRATPLATCQATYLFRPAVHRPFCSRLTQRFRSSAMITVTAPASGV